MSYGVNTWASQLGPARTAGSSSARSTRTAKRRKTGSARRAKKKSTRKSTRKSAGKRRSLHSAQDYHSEKILAPPHDWGGTLAQWQAYRTDKTGKAPGYWL